LANRSQGELILGDDGNGNLNGTVFGDPVVGFTDTTTPATRVAFVRIPVPNDPAQIQVYFGELSGGVLTISGNFLAFQGAAGGAPNAFEFPFTAQFAL
jgi:hypothetical protein